ncbi:hypothetical protein FI667_g2931, partial [Globisporangium splendens]
MHIVRSPAAHPAGASTSTRRGSLSNSNWSENNHIDGENLNKDTLSSGKQLHKQPHKQQQQPSSAFPATEYLMRTVENAIYGGGAFQGVSEHRILDLLDSAKREIKAQNQRIAQLEQQNDKLAVDCLQYRTSVSKLQSHSESLRDIFNGKDKHVQKLVALLQEIHGYEEPELPEDEEQQQQDEEEHHDAMMQHDGDAVEDEYEERELDDRENNESHLVSSNQTEEDSVDETQIQLHALEKDAVRGETVVCNANLSNPGAGKAESVLHAVAAKQPGGCKHGLSSMLSLTVAEPTKKAIHEPKPPRGCKVAAADDGELRVNVPKSSRLKFQFPDSGLNTFLDEGEDGAAAPRITLVESSPSRTSSLSHRRRFSSSSAISTSVPLRRKSFTMKRSPIKGIAVTSEKDFPASEPTTGISTANSSGPNRWATRRKSMSAYYSISKNANTRNSPAKSKFGAKDDNTEGVKGFVQSSLSPRSSQIIVRVRERKLDGVPELVIRKKPARFIVWRWNERQVRVPFMIQLGPHQHGIMLRQLRYVKSVMHDFPWAKAHLKDLLSSYTKKDMTKEQLYPQLNHLSHHVQDEIRAKMKKQKLLAAKKHHLATQLTIAAGVVNDIHMTKFGRRGKPHETKLCYDPRDPTRLHWLRKNGEKSDEFLLVHEIEIHGDSKLDTSVIKRAARKYPLDPECCVSLVTSVRNLDLQLKCPLQRDWLVDALHDIVSFARQYRAAGAIGRRQQSHQDIRALTVHGRR